MKKNISNNKIHLFWSYFASTVCYLIFLLINTLGNTDWFTILPLSVFYNLIYGIIIYSLSCVIYFFINYTFCSKYNLFKAKHVVFLISFLPTLIFSVLVIKLTRLSVINYYINFSSITIWTIILFFSIFNNLINKLKQGRSLEVDWLICNLVFSSIHIILLILSLLKLIPGIISPTFSIVFFLFISILFFIKGFPWMENNNLNYVIEQYNLSPRESEVFKLLVLGKKNDEIAEELYISLSTVKTHIRSIFDKTNSRNRIEVRNLYNESTNTKVLT